MNASRAAVLYFALVFGAGFVLGVLRITLLLPRLGVRSAELAEMPIMLFVIYLSAGYVISRVRPGASAPHWLFVGLLALALLVAAECTLAVLLADRSIDEYLQSRDPVSGTVYLVMLAVYTVMPWLRARRR